MGGGGPRTRATPMALEHIVCYLAGSTLLDFFTGTTSLVVVSTNDASKHLYGPVDLTTMTTAVQIKHWIRSQGGPPTEHQKLFFRSRALRNSDVVNLRRRVTLALLVDESAAFRWEKSKHSSDGDSTFVKPPRTPLITYGTRGAAPLADGSRWRVSFIGLGSHACAGVALRGCRLGVQGYTHLYGAHRSDSWALCFGHQSSAIDACHGALRTKIFRTGAPLNNTDVLVLCFRLQGGSLFSSIDGSSDEVLCFTRLPLYAELFIVASLTWGGGRVTIQRA